jgi:hypothetical protein
MGELKKLEKITKKDIERKGVQALGDRPNQAGQYGVGGLSAKDLKAWFDKLSTFLADKINELQGALAGEDAASYIRIALGEYTTLDDLLKAIQNGDLAAKMLHVMPSADAKELRPIQTVLNEIARSISTHSENIDGINSAIEKANKAIEENTKNIDEKLTMVTDEDDFRRVYGIDEAGKQITIEVDTGGYLIPVYGGGRTLRVGSPMYDEDAVNRKYVDNIFLWMDRAMAKRITIDVDTNTYTLRLTLRNEEGEAIDAAEINLPFESVVMGGRYEDGKLILTLLEGQEVAIEVSNIVRGLASTESLNNAVKSLQEKINGCFVSLDVREDNEDNGYVLAIKHDQRAAQGYTTVLIINGERQAKTEGVWEGVRTVEIHDENNDSICFSVSKGNFPVADWDTNGGYTLTGNVVIDLIYK